MAPTIKIVRLLRTASLALQDIAQSAAVQSGGSGSRYLVLMCQHMPQHDDLVDL